MTMLVTLNIVPATASHHSTTGRPFSPIMPSATAKKMLNDDLKDVAFGHRPDHRFREDVEQDLVPGLRLGGDLARLPHRQVHADAGLHDVDRRQPMPSAMVVTISK